MNRTPTIFSNPFSKSLNQRFNYGEKYPKQRHKPQFTKKGVRCGIIGNGSSTMGYYRLSALFARVGIILK